MNNINQIKNQTIQQQKQNYDGALSRINSTSPQPTLSCAQPEDKIIAKAGLITADEMVYGDALWHTQGVVTGNITYLSNNTCFWTISPSSSSAANSWTPDMVNLYGRGVIYGNQAAARPVITLSANALVKADFLDSV